MHYLVIEHFRNRDPIPVYRRFRAQGRLMPEGLGYISSWITEDLTRCYQVMEAADRRLLEQWMAQWSDLMDFEVMPVLASAEVQERIAPQMSLETAHLSLKPCLPAQLLTLLEQPQRFEQMAGLPAAAGLREMFTANEVSPDWLAELRASPGPDPWRHGFFLVHRGARAVIGSAGFKGPPDPTGAVEIAYGIAPGFEGQGYATEAAGALVALAFDTPLVDLVRAHTLPEANASTRVLAKCGFRHVGTVVDPDDGPVWRWERRREAAAHDG